MKVSLVVGEGVHAGKVIPIPIAQFLIGRDASCHLRPSSPAVSKRHCALIVKGGKLWVKDFGSTNGTFLNDERVTDEVEANDGDSLRVGPLLFTLKVERTVVKSAAAPQKTAPAAAAAAADKPARGEPSAGTATKTNASDVSTDDEAVSLDVESDSESNSARILAMLMDDEEGPTPAPSDGKPDNIPSGTTVMEIPPLLGGEKKDKAKPADKQSTSNAAEEILRKIRQRPRG